MDPYKILGIAPDATEEQIKIAYRNLARKYHPDNYANNPLADLAQEKMKQINEAYDTIQRERRRSSQGGAQSAHHTYQNTRQGSAQFQDIRVLIMQRRIVEAEELLDGVPESGRDAEWYFLKGNIFYNKGWLEQALQYFTRACQLNPSNSEYQAALQQMMWQRGTANPYQTRGYTTASTGGCDCCDVFSTLFCADCCCECMGGDLIRCC